ncbi:MAG: hypothetical protein LBD18_00120 [Treponema sp.]|nr:hypothetical protein [Treponema sp.]
MDFSRIRLFHGKKLKSSFVFIKWIDYISERGNDGYSTITRKAGEYAGPVAALGGTCGINWKIFWSSGWELYYAMGEDFEDMEASGQEREVELRKFLEPPEEIPHESRFFQVF